MSSNSSSLPPGWEAKIDSKSGKTYYINHHDRITSWDHPSKNKKHGAITPKSSSFRQTNGTSKHVHVDIPLQDFSNRTRGSSLTIRSSKIQDSSLTMPTDEEESISRISAMFPTVSDAHIRLLMKKFNNREVLVISALQVEKNPLITPGPFSTPPPQRNIQQYGLNGPLHMTPPLGIQNPYSRGGSPILKAGSGPSSLYSGSPRVGEGFRSTSRPHSSPKLKLRYMKSIFPQAEETIILDILCNNDNNIQKTSDMLRTMGFEKKDSLKISQQKQQAKLKQKETELSPPISPIPLPRIKSPEEKAKMRGELQKEHKEIPEQLITIALESVDFDKERASTLLKDTTLNATTEGKIVEPSEVDNGGVEGNKDPKIPISQSRQSLKSLLKSEKNDKEMNTFNRIVENIPSGQKSSYLSNTKGPNPVLAKGNNESLLLEDYVNWNGPNSDLRKGPQGLAKGSSSNYKLERPSLACGPNSSYKKGPNKSLVTGSIFQQMKNAVPVGGGVRGE